MTSELDGIDLQLLLPELLLTLGLAAIIIIPNLGDAKFRIPLTSFRIPVLIGGIRFPATRDPRLPNWMALGTLMAALVASTMALLDPPSSGQVGHALEVDQFSSLMTNLFICVLILCTVSATQRLPSDPNAPAPSCLLYTSPSPRDQRGSRMPSSA